MPTVISGNAGNGITLRGTHDNRVINSTIGVALDGTTARGQRRRTVCSSRPAAMTT